MDHDEPTFIDPRPQLLVGSVHIGGAHRRSHRRELFDSRRQGLGCSHGAYPVCPDHPAESGVALDEPALRVHLHRVALVEVRRLVHRVSGRLLTTALVTTHAARGPAWLPGGTYQNPEIPYRCGVLVVVRPVETLLEENHRLGTGSSPTGQHRRGVPDQIRRNTRYPFGTLESELLSREQVLT